ncbi:hypothetical protein ACFQ2M_17235 [Kitasatospora saccharophila]|uniref:hypothetical protein n=1 Tax=Kitasatospora saccharophila TaxID=407973 RepID=UPI00362B1E4D
MRHRGRLAEVRDDLLDPQARQANLAAVAEALDAAGVRYLLIPDRGARYRLGVLPGGRAAALAAVAEAFRGTPGTPRCSATAGCTAPSWPSPCRTPWLSTRRPRRRRRSPRERSRPRRRSPRRRSRACACTSRS